MTTDQKDMLITFFVASIGLAVISGVMFTLLGLFDMFQEVSIGRAFLALFIGLSILWAMIYSDRGIIFLMKCKNKLNSIFSKKSGDE